ncbi:hypothetical protein D3C81_970500 [compost metagenome]
MQHFPQHRHRAVALHAYAIQQVVASHQRHRQYRQHRPRQPQQAGQRDHAQADRPDHLQVHRVRRELEGPGEVDQGQFQHHQEQAALEQEGGDGAARVGLALAVQPRRQTGEQHEHRCAQVGQQAADEQGRGHAGRVHRVAHLVLQEERLADVVEQHQQHHGTAQLVDGGQPGGGGRGHVGCSTGVTGYNITFCRAARQGWQTAALQPVRLSYLMGITRVDPSGAAFRQNFAV